MEDFIATIIKEVVTPIDDVLKSGIDRALTEHGFETGEKAPELQAVEKENLPYKHLFVNYGEENEKCIAIFTNPQFFPMFDRVQVDFRFWVIPKDYLKVKK